MRRQADAASQTKISMALPWHELQRQLAGDLNTDRVARYAHATDASLYQVLPTAVVCPRNVEDCLAVIEFARRHELSITPRAAGTSLAGQAVGSGIIVDMSRYFTRVIDVDSDARTARVEPGVIIDSLNQQLVSHGLQFAPDPSTLNRCNIGGAIGNNAWGAHAPRDGTTRDHIVDIDAILSSGAPLRARAFLQQEYAAELQRQDEIGSLLRVVQREIDTHRAEILARYPDPSQVPCNSGYALHVLARGQPWQSDGAPFNLTNLFCGSEGTLGLITAATVKLVRRPSFTVLVCAHFSVLADAIQAVLVAKKYDPAAIELLDQNILQLTHAHPEYQRHRGWIEGDPQAVLLIELSGDDEKATIAAAKMLQQELLQYAQCYGTPILNGSAMDDAWTIRRAGLGLLMGIAGREKPVTCIEDSAVPLPALPAFVDAVSQLFAQHQVRCVYYGSVGMGLIHLRPLLDLNTETGRHLLPVLTEAVADILLRLGGSLSAKHGDGRVRSALLTKMLGPSIVTAFGNIKRAFDPAGMFNPHIIVQPERQDLHWRPTAAAGEDAPRAFAWARTGGPFAAAAQCNGAGVCRKVAGAGTMCPSYRASHLETDTTRARANVIRSHIAEFGLHAGMTHNAVHEVLDRCLGCKGCKRDCPASVDMARLKSEHLQQYYDRFGIPLRALAIANLDWYAKLSAYLPQPVQRLLQSSVAKRALRLHPARQLPQPADLTLSKWFAKRPMRQADRKMVLLNDVFSEYFEPRVGQAAVQLFEAMGWQVILAPCFRSARAALSQGLVRVAQRRLARAAQWLLPHAQAGLPLVGLEPSELLTWRDEAAELLVEPQQQRALQHIAPLCQLAEDFYQQYHNSSPVKPRGAGAVNTLLHAHCHQKAVCGSEVTLAALRSVSGVVVHELASGCCGMAGAFGFELEHYALSTAVGELVVMPAVRKAPADTVVVANGASCRQQILDQTGRQALHPIELIWQHWS